MPGPSSDPAPARPRGYHHGDLRATLVAVAFELIAEQGAHGFTLAEATRRAGVSVAAPYRHFANREELLATAAAQALHEMRELELRAAAEARDAGPAGQLAAIARAYVRFAAERPDRFAAIFGGGIDKGAHPELAAAAQESFEVFLAPSRALLRPRDEQAATRLAFAVAATTHGHATLLAEGAYGPPGEAAADVAERAGDAVAALLRGRRALRRGDG